MFTALLEKLMRHEDLTTEEAADAMREVMEGRVTPASLGALLSALVMKGERPSEIVGLAQTMRSRATRLSRTHAPVFDTCGTGGDRSHTFNVTARTRRWDLSATAAPTLGAALPEVKGGGSFRRLASC